MRVEGCYWTVVPDVAAGTGIRRSRLRRCTATISTTVRIAVITAVSTSAPVRRFLAPREEGMLARGLRYVAMLLLTGVDVRRGGAR